MVSRAEKDLLDAVKALLASNDNKGDFIIRSKDGKDFKVHSFLLKERGHFLKTSVSSNFKEKKDQVLKLAYDSETVKVLVDFLCGQDLKEDIDPSTLIFVIEAAQTYDLENLLGSALNILTMRLASKRLDELCDELVHFKTSKFELGVSICRFVLERKRWVCLEYRNPNMGRDWKQLSEGGDENINVKILNSIFLFAFGFSVMKGSKVEFEIYQDTTIIPTHHFQEPSTTTKDVDEVIVAFKDAIKLPVGTKLKMLARGKGSLGTYTNTYKHTYNCYKEGIQLSASSSPVVVDNTNSSIGWLQRIYF